MDKELNEITEKLSPIERKILPFLNENIERIIEKTELSKISVLKALSFMESKGLVKIIKKEINMIDLGTNGIYYKKKGLPERNLINLIESNNRISIDEAEEKSGLSKNEFKAALGVLKAKAIIIISEKRIILNAKKEEIIKKSLEEQFIESLPLELESLTPEQKYALENLKKRKNIIEIKKISEPSIELTKLGEKLAGMKIESELIEEITPDLIKTWSSNKKFRKYDINTQPPKIKGGKKHFVNQAIEYGKKIWIELGFKEMSGPLVDTSFWVFDALFTPQDHPAREMQDTFFIKEKEGKLPENKITSNVKKSHESGVDSSKGWSYEWKESEAKKIVLRTHTTSVSARMLSKLKKENLPAKYFIIGKVFRNETVDWSHGFEFYQTEGIVIDKNANFRHLLGYLKEFYTKMGFKEIRFRPSFFAYTEPSVEVEVFHPEKKIWIELGGAGIFRPEVTIPLLGENLPVLAWGQGFDRIIMDYYEIKDLREMYANDIKILREKKIWLK